MILNMNMIENQWYDFVQRRLACSDMLITANLIEKESAETFYSIYREYNRSRDSQRMCYFLQALKRTADQGQKLKRLLPIL